MCDPKGKRTILSITGITDHNRVNTVRDLVTQFNDELIDIAFKFARARNTNETPMATITAEDMQNALKYLELQHLLVSSSDRLPNEDC